MPSEPPFTIADRYDVEAEIGRGGFARVFRGRDRQADGRVVAVKLLHPELSGGVAQDRFRREIRILAELQHPNILTLLDWGELDGSLFLVTRLVGGATLEQRLEREGKLPVDEALAITAELVDALAHAHAHGIVHRDVKPSNVLFEDGHAYLHDFGIALLIASDDDERITTTGVGVGSERYMSPEQLLGERTIDGRSDVFALATVLYEMLAGVRPFAAADLQTERRRRIQHAALPVRQHRPAVPEPIERAIAVAMEKDPADRFQSVTEFGSALGLRPRSGSSAQVRGHSSGSAAGRAPSSPDALPGAADGRMARRIGVGVLAVAAVATIALVTRSITRGERAPANATTVASLDTTRYVVFPFDAGDAEAWSSWDQLLTDALARWRGIHTVDLFQVRDAVARRGARSVTQEELRAVARLLGAGRFVRGQLTGTGGEAHVRVALYDTDSLPPLAEATASVPATLAGADTIAGRLAESLLFRDSPPDDVGAGVRETASRGARTSFLAGMRALQSWNLAGADSAFAAASIADDRYARAAFWRAQVRAWRSDDMGDWALAAERLGTATDALAPRERALAGALARMARADYPAACEAYRRLLVADSLDFAAWFGLGECRRRDGAIVRDRTSPSGWRFRTSYHGALVAYRRAFELVPSSGRDVYRSSFQRMNQVLMPQATSVRAGRAIGDSLVLYALPSWDARGDTLVTIPWTADAIVDAPNPTIGTALRKNRVALRSLVTAWTAAFPGDPDALEARAAAEELVGDRAALRTTRDALALSRDDEQRLRLRASEVLLLIRFGAPDSVAMLREAASRADSVLRSPRAPSDTVAMLFAILATLRGRNSEAVRWAQQAAIPIPFGDGVSLVVPKRIVAAKDAFELHAAALTSPDTIRAWASRTRTLLEGTFTRDESKSLATVLMDQGRLLAIPLLGPDWLPSLEKDPASRAARAAATGDTAAVRAFIREQDAQSRALPPSERTLDVVALESWLLARIGDDRGAASRLDGVLDALTSISPAQLRSPILAAALMRGARLRVDVAKRAGDDAGARRWEQFLRALTDTRGPS